MLRLDGIGFVSLAITSPLHCIKLSDNKLAFSTNIFAEISPDALKEEWAGTKMILVKKDTEKDRKEHESQRINDEIARLTRE